jgi:hypothetical protein
LIPRSDPPQPSPSRRTLLQSLALLSTFVGVVACGGGSSAAPSQSSSPAPAPTPPGTPATPSPPAASPPPNGPRVPVSLGARLAVTGHSIPDAVIKYPWAGVIRAAGAAPNIVSTTGPFAGARFRWENEYAAPDLVKTAMQAPGASFDLFLGIEAHGGDYGGRASVGGMVDNPDAGTWGTLWHNLAASTGAQTFYGNFWRNDPPRIFGSAWRASCDLEAPLWDGIIDYINANRAPGTSPMRLVPWLQVYMAIYDAIQAGQITGITMGNLFSDDVHPDRIGRWVQMATMMSVMYHRHPDEMPNAVPLEYGGFETIDAGLAAQLRPVVWAACLATSRAALA